jgi:hypothetical protein
MAKEIMRTLLGFFVCLAFTGVVFPSTTVEAQSININTTQINDTIKNITQAG